MTAIRHKVFVEMNEHVARVARVETRSGRPVITELAEAVMPERRDDEAARMLGEVISDSRPTALLLGLANTRFHLANGEEARAHATADAIRSRLERTHASTVESWRFALTAAGDAPIGASGRAGRWVAAVSGHPTGPATKRALDAIGCDESASCNDAFQRHGAIRRLLKSTGQSREVYAIELGLETSSLFIVSSAGTELVRPVDFTFTHVVDATAAAMNLRMRGAAAKLLANPRYDFTDVSSRIAEQLAVRLGPILTEARTSRGREAAGMLLAGLPSRLGWIGRMLAERVSLAWWSQGTADWLEKAGLLLDERARAHANEPEWFALLGAIEQDARDGRNLNGRWVDGSAAANTTGAVSGDRIEVVNTASEADPASETEEEAVDAPTAAAPQTAAQATVKPEVATPIAASAVSPVAASVDTSRPEAVPSVPEARTHPARKGRGRIAGWVSLAAAVAIVATLGTIYFQKVNEQRDVAEQGRFAAETRAALDAAAREEAEQRAQTEVEARRIAEEQSARRVAEAERGRALATEEATQREAEARRLLDTRGAVRIVTEPAGATVSVGNYAPRTTPGRVEDLRVGKYPVVVSLDGFEDYTTEIEIADNTTVDLGTIRLYKKAGTVSIASIPSGVAFDLRPAGARPFLAAGETWQGKTPAEIESVPPGDYVVTFLRDGWERVSQSIRVDNRRGTTADYRYVGAALRVVSMPSGATVTLNGNAIGTTPLALHDIPPGEITIALQLTDHETAKIVRNAEPAELVDIDVTLRMLDRLYGPNELDSAPQAIETLQPQLSGMPEFAGKRVVIGFEITPAGEPENAVVVEAPNAELGQRCLEAVASWRFTPGIVRGRPVRTRVNLPFVIR